jgi:tetratricopeptide (TPR) repeat protein
VADCEGNTGDWILKHPEFVGWKSQETSALLWIQGKPGSGKSVLMKHILQELNQERGPANSKGLSAVTAADSYPAGPSAGSIQTQPSPTAVDHRPVIASFFYSAREGERETSHRHMLQTLLHEVLQQEGQVYPCIQETYRKLRKGADLQVAWAYNDLKAAFMALCSSCDQHLQIYLLVDGLDESDRGQLSDILTLFHNGRENSVCVVQVVLASRPDSLINPALADAFHVILEDENKKDIASMVETRLQFLDDPSDDLFKWTAEYLKDHAQGVFLWVSIVLREIEQRASVGFSETDIETMVQKLPLDLLDYYKHIARQLAEGEPEMVGEAKKILDWMTYAERPLTAGELWDILAIPAHTDRTFILTTQFFRTSRLRNLNHVGKRLKKCCGDLLEIKRQGHSSRKVGEVRREDLARDDVVQLLHETAREFLSKPDKVATPFNTNEVQGSETIALVCARYIGFAFAMNETQSDDDPWPSRAEDWEPTHLVRFVKRLEPRSLLSYALKYLPHHLRRLERSYLGWKIMEEYYEQTQGAVDSPVWYFLQDWFEKLGFRPTPAVALGERFRINSLIAAIEQGSIGVVRALIETQHNLDYANHQTKCPALQAAAASGNYAIADLLISNGARINYVGGFYGTALHAAANNGHVGVVNMLVDRGAFLDAEVGFFGSASMAAACTGHANVARILWRGGAQLRITDELLGRISTRSNDLAEEDMARTLIATLSSVLGPEFPYTFWAMEKLGTVYYRQERWREAEELVARILESKKKTLSPEDPSTLTSMNNLGAVYYHQGRWKEAEELQSRLLESRKRVMGQEHSDTLRSMLSLAHIWNHLDRDDEARALLKKAAQVYTKVWGRHPSFTETMRRAYEWIDLDGISLMTRSDEEIQAKYHESWKRVWSAFVEGLSPTQVVA